MRVSENTTAGLQYSEEITSGEVNGETSARISQLFGENGLVELTGLIAFQNMSARCPDAGSIARARRARVCCGDARSSIWENCAPRAECGG